MRRLVLMLALLLLISSSHIVSPREQHVFAAGSVTELVLSSEVGDYVGAGKSYSYGEADGRFGILLRDLSHDGAIDDIIFQFSGTDDWLVEIETSNAGTALAPGFYDNAQRAVFSDPGHPGLDVGGNARGCNEVTGSFTILDAKIDTSTATPQLISFAAVFEQHCEGARPALRGHAYYNYTEPTSLSILNPSPLPEATVGRTYSRRFVAGGGAAPYTYDKVSGVIPPGLALSSTGDLSGIPSTSGDYSFDVQVTDSQRRTGRSSFLILVFNPLAIDSPPELPSATLGQPYAYTLSAQGGSPPYRWGTFSSEQLPEGLTLNSNGVISGVPIVTGAFTFVLRIQDAMSREDVETRDLQVKTVAGEVGLTQLSMSSDQEYVGFGFNYFFNRKSGVWLVRARDLTGDALVDEIFIQYGDYASGIGFWSLQFSTDTLGRNLTPGTYDSAQRWPFASSGHPGLSVSGEGRGCNQLTGRFTILDAKFDYSGSEPRVISFAAEFEQHCEGLERPLLGAIYYNSLARPDGPTPRIIDVSYDAENAILAIKGKKFDATVSLIINGELVKFDPRAKKNKLSGKKLNIKDLILPPGAYAIQVATLEGGVSAPFVFSF